MTKCQQQGGQIRLSPITAGCRLPDHEYKLPLFRRPGLGVRSIGSVAEGDCHSPVGFGKVGAVSNSVLEASEHWTSACLEKHSAGKNKNPSA